MVNRTNAEPAPYVIAVVGPPQTGKTTLIKSLIKNYTKQSVQNVRGPITVVTGKKRRITLFECPNNIHAMCDVAKIADLVLLTVDASFGFEMETFEFLNICKIHGFPRVMGVLTHLDKFVNSKVLNKTKKTLKHRFWTEICDGAKCFYLSGLINGRYMKREIHNLARFISVMKFKPLIWRNTHPYVLADRIEDITDEAHVEDNEKCDRTIALFGYVRGTYLKPGQKCHLIGVGDYHMDSMSLMNDPCPLMKENKRRALNEKERKLYAPMSDVGDVMYDKDAVYINIKDNQVNFTPTSELLPDDKNKKKKRGKKGGKYDAYDDTDEEDDEEDEEDPISKIVPRDGEGENIVRQLQKLSVPMDRLMEDSSMQIFANSAPVTAKDMEGVDDNLMGDDDDDETSVDSKGNDVFQRLMVVESDDSDSDSDGNRSRRKVLFKNQLNGFNNDNDDDKDGDDDGNSDDSDEDEDSDEEESDEDGDEDEDSDNEDGYGSKNLAWKDKLMQNAASGFKKKLNLMELVYGKGGNGHDDDTSGSSGKNKEENGLSDSLFGSKGGDSDDDSDSDSDGEFFKLRVKADKGDDAEEKDDDETTAKIGDIDVMDRSLVYGIKSKTKDWNDEDTRENIRNRFVTGKWDEKDGDADDASLQYGENGEIDSDGDDYGDGDEDHGITVDDDGAPREGETEEEAQERRLQAKAQMKKKFDDEHDEDDEDDEEANELRHIKHLKAVTDAQTLLNQTEFEEDDEQTRFQLEGGRSGVYVRIELSNIPYEFIANFDRTFPLILGGLLPSEQKMGFVHARVKRHRWHKKILKTNDPLVFSMGWRRFQSMPIYGLKDPNDRLRFLKYTPEHMHCHATFYGPIMPPATGLLAFRSIVNNQSSFRTSLTGTIIEQDESFKIVKKLKLTGEPHQIFKNTAYIKGMFTSALEVAKFEGATLKTVSGIRGQIKKAILNTTKGPNGSFRATFEDKILMSDIVFCRTWARVQPVEYYNPVCSLLLKNKNEWQGMRHTAQLRREKKVPVPFKQDSEYHEIKRAPRKFNPLRIPKSLQKDLPFASKPKVATKRSSNKPTLDQRRAVVMDKEEKRVYNLFQQIQTAKNVKEKKKKQQKVVAREKHEKQLAKDAQKYGGFQKELRKRKIIAEAKGRHFKIRKYDG